MTRWKEFVCLLTNPLPESLPGGIFMFFSQATMTWVFFSSCLVTNIGKSYCGWLPFPPTIPVAGTIYVTPHLNNNLLLVIFLMVNNLHGCWVIIFISVADQKNLWVIPTAAESQHSWGRGGRNMRWLQIQPLWQSGSFLHPGILLPFTFLLCNIKRSTEAT